MNGNCTGVVYPSFEEGRPRRSNNVSLPSKIGAAGREAQARQRAASREVKSLLHEWSDLPRSADSKVAWHLLDRRCTPSSKEGIAELLIFPQAYSRLYHRYPGDINEAWLNHLG